MRPGNRWQASSGLIVAVVLSAAWVAHAQPTCPALCEQNGYFNKVNVEWRPAAQNVLVGELVELGLYLVPDHPDAVEEVGSLELILNWDPADLLMIATLENDPNDPSLYQWLVRGFSNDGGLDNLNAGVNTPPIGVPFNDGDALYGALAQFPPPFGEGSAMVPQGGLLVTTIRFTATQETLSTEITIPEYTGEYTCSSVLWGVIPGCDFKGDVGTARVRITSEPYLPGDGDGDGDVDAIDYGLFQDCVEAGDPLPDGCWVFDFDVDLDVDLHDFAGFQIARGAP